LSGAIGAAGETDNSKILFKATNAIGVVLDGFDIRKAYNESGFGAAIILSNGSASVRNCRVHDNTGLDGTALLCGGAVSTFTLTNCLFYDNEATLGSVFSTTASLTTIQTFNCTITRNLAPQGHVFAGFSNRTFKFYNSIIWDHSASIFQSNSTVHIFNSIMEDFDPATVALYYDVINSNPNFSDPLSDAFTVDVLSPARNAGDNDFLTSNVDLAFNPRIYDEVIDMGCFEVQIPLIFFVDASSAGLNNGTSWANAFTGLQDALSASAKGQQIWIADGTYKPTAGVNRSISFELKGGVPVYGGFAGTESTITERNYQSNLTILSGNIGNLGIDTDNTYHVLKVNDASEDFEIDGCVVADGYANVGPGNDDNGSAMLLENAENFELRNCWIRDNYCQSNTIWSINTNSPASFTNSVFQNNEAVNLGAALAYNSDIYVENCAFLNNECIQGITFQNDPAAELDMRGCTFYGNALSIAQTSFNIVKGANANALKGQVVNTVIWGNSTNINSKAIDGGLSGQLEVDHCILQGAVLSATNAGENVFYEDPLFANALGGDYKLQVGSMGRNGGNNAFVNTDEDVLQQTRIQNTHVDMGCVESSVCSRPNDHCFQYKTIIVDALALNKTNECASINGEVAGSCSPAIGRSVWYSFNTQLGTSYEISIENVVPISASFNPKIEFFSGECSSLTEIGCANANGNSLGESLLVENLLASESYFIRISGGIGQSGTYNISVVSSLTCTGDFDNNEVVGIADLLVFNATYGCLSNCGATDLDGNGSVGVTDLLIFNAAYGSICP